MSALARQGQLAAKPLPPGRLAEEIAGEAQGALQHLGLGAGCDGLVYVPAGYDPLLPAPCALMLHGAGGNASQGAQLLMPFADRAGLIVLAADSRATTWDELIGGYGPDVAFLDAALTKVFGQFNVDPTRLAIGGFSDGASYALSLGITNGLLFTHILAFSPGFVSPAAQEDRPKVFISHGTHDTVLPIERCSRRIVPALRRAGYDVDYHEFDGPHTVPPQIAAGAIGWFLGPPAGTDSAADRSA